MKRYPRECYKSWIHYLLKISSPSKTMKWQYERAATYFEKDGLKVWAVDKKTNGEKFLEKVGNSHVN